ncbi:hypothetical protein HaLaN_11125 [Haematococcus lacustris]|uniref:Uncharacterized protein n=1 Tax=Haematococcus lacustris TaxID=44745 RepID=A0A699YZJ4_HAELA|nr:hypothetical protein HaLaN_11125 [Haematococcus lacustris]
MPVCAAGCVAAAPLHLQGDEARPAPCKVACKEVVDSSIGAIWRTGRALHFAAAAVNSLRDACSMRPCSLSSLTRA